MATPVIGSLWRAARIVCCAGILSVAFGSIHPGHAVAANATPSRPPAPSAAELKGLVHTLQDKAARDRLIAQLNALIAAQQPAQPKSNATMEQGGGLQQQVTEWIGALRARADAWAAQLRGFSRARLLYAHIAEQLKNPVVRRLWLRESVEMAAALVVALLCGAIGRRLLRPTVDRLGVTHSASRPLRVLRLLVRILLELAPIAVFAAVGYALAGALRVDYVATLLTLAVINALALSRGLQTLVRGVLAPSGDNLRVFKISDETAGYWLVWLRRLVVVSVYGFLAVDAAAAIGLPAAQARALNNLVGLLLTIMLVLLILQNRGGVAGALRSIPRRDSPRAVKALFNRTGDMWHLIAVVYVVAIYLVGLLRIPNGLDYLLRATLLSAVVIAGAKLAARLSDRGLGRLFSVRPELTRRLPGLEKRVNRYVPVVLLSARWLIYIFAALLVLEVWQLDIFGWLSTDVGQRVLGTVVVILLAIGVATAIWEVLSLVIETYLMERTDSHGRHRVPSARARTVMPLLRAVLAITLGTVTGLIVLSQLGINIGPLLAGAGILGLAVGFGSQTLVKDFITGLFILLQDTVSVGDVVNLAGSIGTVEALSIRSIRLRDLSGSVHVIPFSEVTKVINLTKDYSYALFDIGVAYREDMDEVMSVMKALTDEMRQDAEWAPSILEEAEVFGVNAFGDSAITVRVRLKTVAGAQWGIQREFNRRLKRRFDELGIEIPFPHQTIYFGMDKSGNAPPAHLTLEGLPRKGEGGGDLEGSGVRPPSDGEPTGNSEVTTDPKPHSAN